MGNRIQQLGEEAAKAADQDGLCCGMNFEQRCEDKKEIAQALAWGQETEKNAPGRKRRNLRDSETNDNKNQGVQNQKADERRPEEEEPEEGGTMLFAFREALETDSHFKKLACIDVI